MTLFVLALALKVSVKSIYVGLLPVSSCRWTVSVASFTVGIVGLFKISATPLVAFQSELTWAAGIGGVFVKSL